MKNAGQWRVQRWLPAFLAAAVLALCSSCSAPGASSAHFMAMPPPSQGSDANYATTLGPVTGTGPKTFIAAAGPDGASYLACLGKGRARLLISMDSGIGTGTLILAFSVRCDDGGIWGSGSWTQDTHLRTGQKVTVRVSAAPTTKWKLRIDAAVS